MSKLVILKSRSHAHLNPLHSGFAHGFGIFETIRLTGGRLEFWTAHYERFLHSAKTFNLHFDEVERVVLAAIRELVESEKVRDGIIKLSLLSEGKDTCCYVYVRSIEQTDEKITLHLDTQSSLNENSVLAGHKTHNYMESMYLKQFAQKNGFFDAVRLNTTGLLAETTLANLFFVKEDRLYTPALSTGILPGVIRAEVLDAARTHSIPVEEGNYSVECLKSAETAFLTNSSVGIMPVSSFFADDSTVTYTLSSHVVDTLRADLDDKRKRKSTQFDQ